MKSFLVTTVLFVMMFCLSVGQELYPETLLSHQVKIGGYFFNGDKIVFVFDIKTNEEVIKKKLKEGAAITSISVMGSFNGWKGGDSWKMVSSDNGAIWFLEKKIAEISIPGNSGQPEFKFYAEGEYTKNGSKNPTEGWFQPVEELPIGYKFSDQFENENNFLVIFPGDNIEEIAKNHYKAVTLKKEFLTENELTNFREVKTGNIKEEKLYRSYHPFIKSKKGETETKRLAKIVELFERNKINSVINLADGEDIYKSNRVPPYYRGIMDRGNLILAETSYNDVYFKSDKEAFAVIMGKIIRFIGSHEPPYLVHCRLGTDRTGVVTAVIEAMMGAEWKNIADDYAKSNDVGMGEYRNEKLLKYSFENMLKIKIDKEQKIDAETKKFLIEKSALTEAEINSAIEKLSK